MRTIVVAVMVTFLTALVVGQTGNGELRGVLSSARGPLADVQVRIKNVDTGDVTVTTTSSAGEYTVAVTPGTYDVVAAQVGYVAFARRQLVVASGASIRADGVMADNANAGHTWRDPVPISAR